MAHQLASIDAYLAGLGSAQRATLQKLRRVIRSLVPQAEECISYRIPAFRVRGRVVAGFCARRDGCSYFPFSGRTLRTLADALSGFEHTKSSLHFDTDRPLPVRLVRQLVKARLLELEDGGVGVGPRRSPGRGKR